MMMCCEATAFFQVSFSPIMVIQPENWWLKGVGSHAAIDDILDGI